MAIGMMMRVIYFISIHSANGIENKYQEKFVLHKIEKSFKPGDAPLQFLLCLAMTI
jgi:hypothetical protein